MGYGYSDGQSGREEKGKDGKGKERIRGAGIGRGGEGGEAGMGQAED